VRTGTLTQVLCFMRTKHGASRLARQLQKDGFAAESIHGDKSQQARMEALDAFKEGKLQVLVATDVAARGLDIEELPHVLNYELPHVPEDYIHRIGRTGRAGLSGEAISFVAPEEEKYLAEIERLLKKTVPILTADGFDVMTGRMARPERGSRPTHREGSGRSERAPRTPPGARAERASRAPASGRDGEAGTEDQAVRERPHGDARREERERAYALNPDQPLPPPAATAPAPGGALMKAGAHHGRHSSHKARPVPALLMKRPAREPENV
jgi:ATP-dependent RNA helicase RhlE